MKILLIGERYSNNLGDGVIYDTVENICSSIYKNCEFISFDISGGSKYRKGSLKTSKIKLFLKPIKKKLSYLKRKHLINKKLNHIDFNKIDGAIFVGGQLFFDYFSYPIYKISKKLNEYNIPVIFNCCGLGKNNKLKNIRYLEKALNYNNVKAISIRDNKEIFKFKYSINKDYELILDPVFEISKYYKPEVKKSDYIGIGLMEPKLFKHNHIDMSEDQFLELIKNIINTLEKMGKKWKFFCNGDTNDYNYIVKVCKYFNLSKDVIARRPLYPKDLINSIYSFEKIISFRLHSHIIAASYNIPMMGFYWDNKVKEFSKTLNVEKYFYDINPNIISDININITNFINDNSNINYLSIIKTEKDSSFLTKNIF